MIALGTLVLGFVLGLAVGVRVCSRRYHRIHKMQRAQYVDLTRRP